MTDPGAADRRVEVQSPRRLAQEFVAAMSKGADWEAWEALVDDNCVYVMQGQTRFSGRHEGKEAILGLNELIDELLAEDLEFEIHDTLEEDDRCVVLLRGGAPVRTAEADYENEYCWILRFADAKLIEWIEYMDTARTNEAVAAEERARADAGAASTGTPLGGRVETAGHDAPEAD